MRKIGYLIIGIIMFFCKNIMCAASVDYTILGGVPDDYTPVKINNIRNSIASENNLSFDINFTSNILNVHVNSIEHYILHTPFVGYKIQDNNVFIGFFFLSDIFYPVSDELKELGETIDYDFNIDGFSQGIYNFYFLLHGYSVNSFVKNIEISEGGSYHFDKVSLSPKNILNCDLEWVYCYNNLPIDSQYISYERLKAIDKDTFEVTYSKSGDYDNDSYIIGRLHYKEDMLYALTGDYLLPDNYWMNGSVENELSKEGKELMYPIFSYIEDGFFLRDFHNNLFYEIAAPSSARGILDLESSNHEILLGLKARDDIYWIEGIGYTGKIAASLCYPSINVARYNTEYRSLLGVRNIKDGQMVYLNPERENEWNVFSGKDCIESVESILLEVSGDKIICTCEIPFSVEIYDCNSVLLNKYSGEKNEVIDISTFDKGWYIVKAKSENDLVLKKILR